MNDDKKRNLKPRPLQPMERAKRVEVYTRGLREKYADGLARLTPAQRRRVRKHDNKFWDSKGLQKAN